MQDGLIFTPQGNIYSETSLRNYEGFIKTFEFFEKESNKVYYLEDINFKFFETFRIYLHSKNLAKNTITRLISNVKAVQKRLYRAEKTSFSGVGVQTSNELTTSIFTSEEELELMIEQYDNLSEALKQLLDKYYIHCYLGLRFSDFSKIMASPKTFLRFSSGYNFFEIKTGKTGEVVSIPISRKALKIFERNNYEFSTSSLWNYSKQLKRLGKAVGMFDQIVHSRTQGGKRVDTVKYRWQMMSSHTARRSFATNAYLAGVPILNIMKITGHKTTHSFLKYIRCDSLQSARSIADHPFFN